MPVYEYKGLSQRFYMSQLGWAGELKKNLQSRDVERAE